jgi:hypothetical protein
VEITAIGAKAAPRKTAAAAAEKPGEEEKPKRSAQRRSPANPKTETQKEAE